MPKRSDLDTDLPTSFFAEGEAALWLTESLVLVLLDRGLLQPEEVLEAIEIVVQAKQSHAEEGRSPEVARAAAALLSSLSASIAAQANRTTPKAAEEPPSGREKV